MENIIERELEIVCLMATDWSYYEQQAHIDSPFDPIDGIIVGLLIQEDDEKYVLAHQWFPREGEVRHVTVITKTSVQELHRLKIFEDE